MKFIIAVVALSTFQCILGNVIPFPETILEGTEYGDKVQGDLILTAEQFDAMYNNSTKAGKTGLLSSSYRWPKNSAGYVQVPYTFRASSGFTQSEKNVIISGMQEIQKYTCVRFIQRTSQADYVEIINDSGCWSYLGRRGGKQSLSLMRNVNGYGCVWKATAMHELIHALGYTHMQNRFDRDSYVKVYLENVTPDARHNFDKVNPSYYGNFNTAYDLNSIMHYGRKSFSSNGRDVIVPYDGSKINVIGQAQKLSSGDIARIKNMYQC
ncbi:CLUMA_CG003856, isoform A [Clunio marinus]|uniref:Metalloendopeptidase n=1 Tax=Clunio marinus TaxID=568069 RepID=A0A1J1HRX6_9DIPT|nr:CLUMA_CG003856, isoform A [Clunio marinus]